MTGTARARAGSLVTTEAVEDYVKAIYSLQRSGEKPVSTSALAERLGVTAPSASAMVRKLAGMKLVRHVRYHGFLLTQTGERLALEVLRHHRLLELYLFEAFEMPWDQVHAEAEALEHVLSEELEELIALKLGDPKFDPHGDPIPSRDGVVDELETVALSELEPGQRGIFTRVSDSDPEMLRYLSARGVKPGQELEVRDKQPLAGSIHVRVGRRDHAFGGRLALAMRVKLEH
jgi:DtxR family Mn-dependent transcriptional regulator